MSGFVLWRGPSLIDKKPIVVIVTTGKSQNIKTGDMVQSWILPDNGLSPFQNLKSGGDESVCGDCIHRPQNGKGGSCYVNLLWGPNAIYKSYIRGNYPNYNANEHNKLIRGRAIRFGSYGEPTAIPYKVWLPLLKLANSHTGYTHRWRSCDPRFKDFCMASADTTMDVANANLMGWRTFRVRTDDGLVLPNEIICPASKEGGQRLTCATCKACHGSGHKNARNIVIKSHGWTYKKSAYKRNLLSLETI